MPGRIRQADVDEVKARTNIADIVGERVALKPAGVGALKGLCPFHDERSPSFNVRPAQGYYHCFGCQQSGDVYTFLREMDHVSFTEAVERLAARLGYPLHYEDGGAAHETSGRSRLYAANAAAAEWFRERLAEPEAEIGRRFLGERGFDAGAAAHFGVGYAPKGWSGLLDAITAKGFTRHELIAAGLVSQGQRGVYDRFRGRLVWPIRDVTGQVVGFGARRLHDDDQGPKYLNTPETPIYKKSQVLYGLDLAKRDISRDHRVVVVEGYTDVMACHLSGVTTAVATCGTAFGGEHITVLRRVMGDDTAAGEVVFTFDPDEAGQRAALRAFGDEKRFAAQTYVAVAPDGLDPCDLRLQRGEDAVRALVGERTPMFEFVIARRLADFDLSSVEGRVGALKAAAPIVADIRDPALRPRYIRELARRLGEELADVRAEVERAARSGGRSDPQRGGIRAERATDGPDDRHGDPRAPEPPRAPDVRLASIPRGGPLGLERNAVMGFLQYGHVLDPELLARALAVPLQHPGLDAVRAAIAAAPDRTRPGWAGTVAESVREPYRMLAIELLTGEFPDRDEERARASAADLARRLVIRSIEAEKATLLGAVQRVPPDSEEGRRVRLRLRELDAERTRLSAE